MMYFKYIGKIDPQMSLEIFERVRKYEPLAKKTYGSSGSNWELALDDTYFHVLRHYDSSKGPLDGYIAKIVKTIGLNNFSRETNKEVESDILLDISSDKLSMMQDESTNPCNLFIENEEGINHDSEVRSCVEYLLPYFLKDYEVFYTKGEAARKLSYKGIFDRYSVEVLYESVNILLEYYEDAKRIGTLSKNCHIRNFASDRYKSSLDKTIIFISKIGDIVKCKMAGARRKKYAYSLNIDDFMCKLVEMFFTDDGVAKVNIYGNEIYCSLSGQFCFNLGDLKSTVEKEVVGSILALRTNLKVINYKLGDEIIFSSSNEDEPSIIISMFGTGVYIPLTRLSVSNN